MMLHRRSKIIPVPCLDLTWTSYRPLRSALHLMNPPTLILLMCQYTWPACPHLPDVHHRSCNLHNTHPALCVMPLAPTALVSLHWACVCPLPCLPLSSPALKHVRQPPYWLCIPCIHVCHHSTCLPCPVESIQYAATWYLPAGVLVFKCGSSVGSRVITTQRAESKVYIYYMKCM